MNTSKLSAIFSIIAVFYGSMADHHEPCSDAYNYVFVIDESGSVGAIDYKKSIDFVKNIITNHVGPTSNVAALAFSSVVDFIYGFNNDQTSRNGILGALEAEKSNFASQYTDTASAMRAAIDQFQNAGLTEDNIIVLVTDGVPCCNAGYDPCQGDIFNDLNNENIRVAIVGVSGGFDPAPVSCLADAQDIIEIPTFDDFLPVIAQLESLQVLCPPESPPVGCIRKWSEGNHNWPDQACNPTYSFGHCNTNDQAHADSWAQYVCELNGYVSGTWTGSKQAGCAGEISVWCQGAMPCNPLYETQCYDIDQTQIEVECCNPGPVCYDADQNSPCNPLVMEGLYYYPSCDPTKFIQCSDHGDAYEMPCPPGLEWDQSILTCNWPSSSAKTGSVVHDLNGDNLNDVIKVTNNNYSYYGVIMLIGVIAFILINNVFIGCWCLGKGKGKEYSNVKFDMVGDDDEI